MFDIVGFENPCMDIALNIDRMPEANGGGAMNDFSFQGGGKLATGMIAAARLGAKCKLIGSMCDDVFGRACKYDFERHGIDVSDMPLVPGRSSVSVVLSDRETNGRAILYRESREQTKPEHPEMAALGKYLFIAHLSGINIPACEAARKAGTKVFMDADGMHDGIREHIGLVDYFIASEFVYRAMFADSADYKKNTAEVRRMGPEVVVFTFGEKGLVGADENGFFRIGAYEVPVMDTLGAGDVFHGAYLAGLIRGMDAREAARFASAVAAVKCTRPGGRSGIPDYEMTKRFMQTGEIDFTELDERLEYYRRGLEHGV